MLTKSTILLFCLTTYSTFLAKSHHQSKIINLHVKTDVSRVKDNHANLLLVSFPVLPWTVVTQPLFYVRGVISFRQGSVVAVIKVIYTGVSEETRQSLCGRGIDLSNNKAFVNLPVTDIQRKSLGWFFMCKNNIYFKISGVQPGIFQGKGGFLK